MTRPQRRARHADGSVGERLARQGYAEHGAELYRTALARLGEDADAQDAVQETMLRAWRGADRFDPDLGSLRTWLFAILRNVVHDHWTAKARRPVPADLTGDHGRAVRSTEPHGALRVADPATLTHDADLVVWALAQLGADHRHAIVETYLRDRSYDEVARELGVPLGTLRSRVHHGLRHLRRAIDTMDALESDTPEGGRAG